MSVPIFHSYPYWMLSGVCSWSTDLIDGLPGLDQRILLTGLIPRDGSLNLPPAGLPCNDIRLPWGTSFERQWDALVEFLTRNAPCIYIPNIDFDRGCAVGRLPSTVAVCSVLHSDEECYYEEACRLGDSWDQVVAVSQVVLEETARRIPRLKSRLVHIPHGIPLPTTVESRTRSGPIRLLFANRLAQLQKRVFDLPSITDYLVSIGVDFTLTVAGDGPDAAELILRFKNSSAAERVTMLGRIPRSEAMALGASHDVFMLPSDFEGLPISLLEAMGHGAVPIVYDIRSGVRDVVDNGINGFRVPHGSVPNFAAAISTLAKDRDSLSRMSRAAAQTIRDRYSLGTMCATYAPLFEALAFKAKRGECRNRVGRIHVPPHMRFRARVSRRMGQMILSLRLRR